MSAPHETFSEFATIFNLFATSSATIAVLVIVVRDRIIWKSVEGRIVWAFYGFLFLSIVCRLGSVLP